MENKLTITKGSLPTLSNGNGLGFEALESSDLVATRLQIVQPATQTETPQGNFFDSNSGQDYGKELNFFVLSKRTTHFIGKDYQTKEEKLIEKKEMLVMPEALDYPLVVSLSVSGYWPLSNLMTKLFKSYGKAGYPMFTGLIKATTELVMGEKGKYYIPKFEFVRHATQIEMDTLLIAYNEVVPLFRQNAQDEPTPTGAPFVEPTGTPLNPLPKMKEPIVDIPADSPIARALGINQKEEVPPPADDSFGNITL